MLLLQPKRQLRILDFDIENRPLSYLGMDFTLGEITAIAAQFIGESTSYVWALGEVSPEDMLFEFRRLFDAADIVTGHYILNHDLPIISDTLFELGLAPLTPKLVSDTKIHLRAGSKVTSKSQENLGELLGLDAPKVQMNQIKWREANRLTPEGIALTKERVVGDVVQHMQLREALAREGRLDPPILWNP